jgi:hypothetical protein
MGAVTWSFCPRSVYARAIGLERLSCGAGTCMKLTTDQLIELFKTGVWPALVLGVFYNLRHEIKRAFPRITKFGWSGFELGTEQTPSQPTNIVSVTAGDVQIAPQSGFSEKQQLPYDQGVKRSTRSGYGVHPQ